MTERVCVKMKERKRILKKERNRGVVANVDLAARKVQSASFAER